MTKSNKKIDFNGSKLKVEDILKQTNKTILLNLYIKTHDLEKICKSVCGKIDKINTGINNQWKNIGKNKTAIGYIKGVISILSVLVVAMIGYLAYTR